MQKEAFKRINAATVFDRISNTTAQIRKNLEDIDLTTLENLENPNQSSVARNMHTKLNNEINCLHALVLQLQESRLGKYGNQKELQILTAYLPDISSLKDQQFNLIGDNNVEHIKYQKQLEYRLSLVEKTLPILRQIQQNAISDLASVDMTLFKKNFKVSVTSSPSKKASEPSPLKAESVSDKLAPQFSREMSPLQYAAHMGCIPAVEKFCELLVKQDPENLGLTGDHGVMAICYAAGNAEQVIPHIVKTFKSAILKILFEAMDNDHHQIVDIILRSTPEEINQEMLRKLFHRVFQSTYTDLNPDLISRLAEKVSAPVDDKKSYHVLLEQIAELKKYDRDQNNVNVHIILALLKSAKSLLATTDDQSRSFLHAYCLNRYDLPAVVNEFFDLTPDKKTLANLQDKFGNIALHYATKNNLVFTAKTLIALSKINTRNHEGKTALHIAAEEGNLEILILLFQSGADPFIKDNNGDTPLDIARRLHSGLDADQQKQDSLTEELAKLNALSQKANQDPTKNEHLITGLLLLLYKELVEYHQLTAIERGPHRNREVADKIASTLSKIKDIKEEIMKANALQDKCEAQALLVGVGKLQQHKLCEQQRRHNLQQCLDILTCVTQFSDTLTISPPSSGQAVESDSLSHRTRKRLIKNGFLTELSHNKLNHTDLETRHLIHPVEVFKLYAKAHPDELRTLIALVNPNTRDHNGVTALHIAHALGYQNTYDRLLSCNANDEATLSNGVTAANATWQNIKDYVQFKSDNVRDDKRGFLPVHLFTDGKVEGNTPSAPESYFIQPMKQKLLERYARSRLANKKNRDTLKASKKLHAEMSATNSRQNMEISRLKASLVATGKQLADANIASSPQRTEDPQLRIALQKHNLPFVAFKTHMVNQVLKSLTDAKSDKYAKEINDALVHAKLVLENILNEKSDLLGTDRVTKVKADLVAKLNEILQGKIDVCAPLLKQHPLIALLKGLIGVILGAVCLFVPLASERYRTYFFKSGHVQHLNKVKHEVIHFDQRTLTTGGR